MALGRTNNGNNRQQYQPSVYSPYRFSNIEGAVESSRLSITYWNNYMKVIITPRKNTSNDEVSWDDENALMIYLTHTKARLLAMEIKNFLSDQETYNSAGVPSGEGLITISNGYEFNVAGPCLVIRKVDGEGCVTASIMYEFKKDYHYTIRNYEVNDGVSKFDKCTEDYNFIEVEQFMFALMSYAEAMTSAVAYTVIDQMKYENSRMNTKMETLASALGVSFTTGNGGGQRAPRSESVFNKAQPTSFTRGSASDLDDL